MCASNSTTSRTPQTLPERSAHPVKLSIIVPVFNEEANLPTLYERLRNTLANYDRSYELLFVDDGSTDNSFGLLRGLFEADPTIRVIRFARNFGQQMAVSAGLQYARGDVVVLLDADLQVAPEEIPKLADKLAEGHDIVYGIRTKRTGSLVRRIGSWGMSHLLYRITGIDMPDSASGFIAVNRRFANTINLFNEKSRYLSGLFAWLSYGRWAAVPVRHQERHAGESKYSVTQLIALTLNFICNFTVLPLRLSLFAGILFMILSVLGILTLLGAHLQLGQASHFDAWLIVSAVAFFAGVQLAALGILGEYMGRVYREVKEQPAFVVREVLDHETPATV